MRYTAYLLCEPGMDRPCFSHTPPSDAQRARLAEKGGRVYELDLIVPGFEQVDGILQPTLTRL